MINEKDIRLLNERRKDYERAARNYREAREARARDRRQKRSAWARIAALFIYPSPPLPSPRWLRGRQ